MEQDEYMDRIGGTSAQRKNPHLIYQQIFEEIDAQWEKIRGRLKSMDDRIEELGKQLRREEPTTVSEKLMEAGADKEQTKIVEEENGTQRDSKDE